MEPKVAKNTAYLVAAFVGQKLLSFVYFALAARAVGQDGIGLYSTATALTTIFSVFTDLGLSNVLVREVAKHKEQAERLLGNVLGAKVLLAAIAVVAVGIAGRVLYPGNDTLILMIAIASAVMVLDTVHLVFYGTIRGFQDLRYEAIGVVSGQAVTFLAGAPFVLAGLRSLFGLQHGPVPAVQFLIAALVCGSTWNVVWGLWCVRRKLGFLPRPRFDGEVQRFFLRVAPPFALAGMFTRVYSFLDTIILSRVATVGAVGAYSVANKLTFAFQFIPMSFAAAVYPAMSEYHVSNRSKLGSIVVSSTRFLLMAAVPIAFGIAALAGQIVHSVYGNRFNDAIAPLEVLIFALIPAFLYWPYGSLLNACDRASRNTFMLGITMACNAGLNAFLIPHYGALGAAWAALLCNVVLWAGSAYASRGLADIPTLPLVRSFLQITLAGAVMAVVTRVAASVLPLPVVVPLAALTYLTALIVSGGLRRDESRMLLDIVLRRGGKRLSDIVTQ